MSPDDINNGRRVALPFAAGPAGLVEAGDTARLSFVRARGAQPRVGSTIDVDGDAWSVIASAPSSLVTGMVVLTLQKAPADAAD